MTEIYKTYHERAYCSKGGYARINEVLRMCRWLYNQKLEERRNTFRACGKDMTQFVLFNSLTPMRSASQRWDDLSLQIMRGVMIRMDRAFRSFFKRNRAGENPGYPRFKGPGQYRCIEIPVAYHGMVKGNRVLIKGLPTIRVKPSRNLPDSRQLKTIFLVMGGRKLYVNLVYKENVDPFSISNKSVGIDMGVSKRMTLSNGEIISRRGVNHKEERRLQRALSRCQKGSEGQRKARQKLNRFTHKESVRNRNECHRITSHIIKHFGKIVAEDLDIREMTRRGRRRRSFNRAVLTQTWGMIIQQLVYKAEWAGRQFVKVSPAYTSRKCSKCKCLSDPIPHYRMFECNNCGYVADRDENAANNILARGAFAPVA